MSKEVVKYVAVTTILVVYLLVGAPVFHGLESNKVSTTNVNSTAELNEFLARGSCFNSSELEKLLLDVITAYDEGSITYQTQTSDPWDYGASLVFAVTVITTIGYGHISPITAGGRVFTIFYALMGIPLTAFFLLLIGQKLHIPLKSLKKKVFWEKHKKIEKVLKSILVALLGLTVLLFLPAVLFRRLEGWTYLEGVYFGVITLTTIGFGDFVPENRLVAYRLFCAIWIYVGLAWVSMILTDVSDYIQKTDNKIGDKIDRLSQKRKISDDGNSRSETVEKDPSSKYTATVQPL